MDNYLVVEPQFYNHSLLIKNPPLVFRRDILGNRKYYTFNKDMRYLEAGSCTTILNKVTPLPSYLEKWRAEYGLKKADEIASQSAKYGTLLHICIADFLKNRKFDLLTLDARIYTYIRENFITFDTHKWEEKLKQDLTAFAKFTRDYDVEPLAVEIVLISERLKYGGAIDLVCKMRIGTGENGKILKSDIKVDKGGQIVADKTRVITAVIDFKSGRHGFSDSNAAQVHMYRNLWMEYYPHIPIDRVFNWAPKDWNEVDDSLFYLKDQTDSIEKDLIKYYVAIFYKKYNSTINSITTINGTLEYGSDISKNISIEKFEEIAYESHKELIDADIRQKAIVKNEVEYEKAAEKLLELEDIKAPEWDIEDINPQGDYTPNDIETCRTIDTDTNFGIEIEEISYDNIANLFKD